MKRQLCIRFALIILFTLPAPSFAFYQLGEINEYLSYDHFKVITRWDDASVYHPRLKGRLINETNDNVYVVVHIYFCDIFKQRHNSVTISKSLRAKEKAEFDKFLDGSEYERTRDAHHIEFQFGSLIVGGKNMLK